MANKEQLLKACTPIREEDTQQSDISHAASSHSKKSYPRSATYSNADRVDMGGASVHSYSEIFESATRESIDETQEDLRKPKRKGSKLKAPKISSSKTTINSSTRQSITWTHKYTTEQIEKAKDKIGWDELVNLEQLYSLKMINTVEYKMRKRKIVDSMTGTKVNVERENKMSKIIDECKNPPQRRILGETEIINEVVDFSKLSSERAIRHSCHIKMVRTKRGELTTTEEWSQDMSIVKMATNPFTNGTLRYVYYMQDVTDDIDVSLSSSRQSSSATAIAGCATPNTMPSTSSANIMAASANTVSSATYHAEYLQKKKKKEKLPIENAASHVAKISIDPMEEYETYFHDVAMQKHAQRFADEFNKNEVPKKVGFLDCWVYELVDRTPHIFCGVEKLIVGDYHKYTNNWDWVNQQVDRNTPSAFSHFTYEASKHRILICDLQGVGDLYTDPQMHTFDGKGCGKGNMGKRGIEKFLGSHKCNAICVYLKLPSTNLGSQFTGTVPQKRYMNNEEIDQVPVTNGQYTVPDTSQTNGQYYGATTTKSMLLPATTNNDDDYSDSGSEEHGFPFGKRIDDEDNNTSTNRDGAGEATKCWCTVL
eukprot:CAMPEP_0197022338 /NCGR_PEP_ID=MMETSP1384-20130603/3249_1 /TAXON_ID=29189 /ORGANISM="Ammonia sp." /LENGTH=595 /DNA_ID=CAMNT_0042450369 /DNA_START=5 /DNA_END=1792 /DNA_ORIENTATION=-